MAVQLLQVLSPATIIAVDQRQHALDLASEVGATHTVAMGGDAEAQVRTISGGRGADVVLDFVGADATMALGATVTRPLGHLTIVGIAGGTLPVSFFGIAYEVSVATTYWGSLPELVEVLALASLGRIHARIEQFPLARAGDAYASMRAGKLRGRAVVVP